MRTKAVIAGIELLAALVAAPAFAQAPQTVRLRGVIEKVDGQTVLAKSDKGADLKLNLADKMLVVEVVKASLADIKPGDFIGSGAMPQPDGSQKAIEVHIFAEFHARHRRRIPALGRRAQQHHDQRHGRHDRHQRQWTGHYRQIQGRREEHRGDAGRADRALCDR